MPVDNKKLEELKSFLKEIIPDIIHPEAGYLDHLTKFATFENERTVTKWANVTTGYEDFLKHCLKNQIPYGKVKEASQILIDSVNRLTDTSLSDSLQKIDKHILSTSFKPLNEACEEIIHGLSEIVKTHTSDSLGEGNFLGFSQKVKELQEKYKKAESNKKYSTLETELKKLEKWCEKQAEKTEHSNLRKIGTYISSALGLLGSYISGNEEGKKTHKACMKQIADDLTGKSKDFKDGLKTLKTTVKGYSEKIKEEKDHPSYNKQFR